MFKRLLKESFFLARFNKCIIEKENVDLMHILKNKIKAIMKIAYSGFYSLRNKLIPWTIKPTPMSIGAYNGWPIESPPKANDTIPKMIINTEAIFDICESETRPVIPAKIIRIPMT